MFICNPCLSKSYENSPSFSRSFGTCEICHTTNDCNDIKSSSLLLKRKKEITSSGKALEVNAEKSKSFNAKDLQVKIKAVREGMNIMGPPALDYISGRLDKKFMKLKKYKRMNAKRRIEMQEWQVSLLTEKFIQTFQNTMEIMVDAYAKPKDRKALKKMLSS